MNKNTDYRQPVRLIDRDELEAKPDNRLYGKSLVIDIIDRTAKIVDTNSIGDDGVLSFQIVDGVAAGHLLECLEDDLTQFMLRKLCDNTINITINGSTFYLLPVCDLYIWEDIRDFLLGLDGN